MIKPLKILVTGASSGIGRATALELAERGHLVFAAARRAAVLEEIASASARIEPLPLDVTNPDAIADARKRVDEITNGYGLDVLVNCAGFVLPGPVETLSQGALERQFATNVFGLLGVTRAFLPAMRQRRSGRVINVSSVLGRATLPGVGAYAATKHALEAFSDALRMELAPYGVAVVLIEPSFVATDIGVGSARENARFESDGNGYDSLIATTRAFLSKSIESAMPPEVVGRRIANAVEARRPKARYLVPRRSKAQVTLLGALPAPVADRAKRRVVGLEKA